MVSITDLTIINAVICDGETSEGHEGTIRIVDGRTVNPGLIDERFHAYAASLHGGDTVQSYLAFVAVRMLGSALRRGFTTVRDVAGGDAGLVLVIYTPVPPSVRLAATATRMSAFTAGT